MKHFRFARWYPLLVIILACLIVLFPLFKTGFPVTDDGDWMIIRLSAFFQSLRQGQFPVRFLGRLNLNYGYPVADFLYPGFLYIGSAFHVIGLSFIDSVKLVIVTSVIGAAVTVFLWLRRRFTAISALTGTLSLVFAPYITFDIFKRGSVGEILAVFAASLVFLAAESGNQVFMAAATAFLIVSHNTLALMFMTVFCFYLIASGKYRYFWGMALGFLMSAFFWIPAIVERVYVRFDTVTVSNPFEYFASGTRIVLIPVTAVVAFLIPVIFRKPGKEGKLDFFALMFSAVLFFATPVSAPLWNIDAFSRLVQFPYRFLAIMLFAGAWITASLVDKWPRWRIAVAALFVSAIILQWRITRVPVTIADKPDSFYSTNEATTTVADEYMPVWVKALPEKRPPEKVEFIKGFGTITHMRPGTDVMDFEIFSESDGEIRINKIYFPGWGVTVNGIPVPVSVVENDGVMSVPIRAGTSRVEADFRETPGRFAVDLISVGAIVTGMVILVSGFVRKRKSHARERQSPSKKI